MVGDETEDFWREDGRHDERVAFGGELRELSGDGWCFLRGSGAGAKKKAKAKADGLKKSKRCREPVEWLIRERNKVFECNFSYLKEISDRVRGACRVSTCSSLAWGFPEASPQLTRIGKTPQGPLVKHRGQRTEPASLRRHNRFSGKRTNPLQAGAAFAHGSVPRPNQHRGCCYLQPHVVSLSRKCLDAKAKQRPPMRDVADCVCHRSLLCPIQQLHN